LRADFTIQGTECQAFFTFYTHRDKRGKGGRGYHLFTKERQKILDRARYYVIIDTYKTTKGIRNGKY